MRAFVCSRARARIFTQIYFFCSLERQNRSEFFLLYVWFLFALRCTRRTHLRMFAKVVYVLLRIQAKFLQYIFYARSIVFLYKSHSHTRYDLQLVIKKNFWSSRFCSHRSLHTRTYGINYTLANKGVAYKIILWAVCVCVRVTYVFSEFMTNCAYIILYDSFCAVVSTNIPSK